MTELARRKQGGKAWATVEATTEEAVNAAESYSLSYVTGGLTYVSPFASVGEAFVGSNDDSATLYIAILNSPVSGSVQVKAYNPQNRNEINAGTTVSFSIFATKA
jgi:hypothetical protein